MGAVMPRTTVVVVCVVIMSVERIMARNLVEERNGGTAVAPAKGTTRPLFTRPPNDRQALPTKNHHQSNAPSLLSEAARRLAGRSRPEAGQEAHHLRKPGAVLALRLLLLTGARTDEILGLKWIDWTHELATLRGAKTGARDVPVSTAVLDPLREVERSGPLVYATATGRTITSLQRTWSVLRRRAVRAAAACRT